MADNYLLVAGFLSDESLLDTRDIVDTEASMQRVGYYDGVVDSYFKDPVQFVDNRATRLDIVGNPATGRMAFHLDSDAADGFGNESLIAFLQELHKANPTAAATWQNSFFNIVETSYLMQNTTAEDLNALFRGSAYEGYLLNTIELSADVCTVPMVAIDPSTTTPNVAVSIRKHIKFSMTLGTGYNPVTFLVYLSNYEFEYSYPMTHLIKVAFPCAADKILDFKALTYPDAMALSTNVLADEIAYANITSGTKIPLQRQTGIYKFTTRYVPLSEMGATYDIPFLIPYHGCLPALATIKTAVREELRTRTGAAIDTLGTVFPELFADGKVYIVPFWGNTSTANNSPSGILDVDYAQRVAIEVFSNLPKETFDTDWIKTKGQYIRAANSSMLMITLASKANLDGQFELGELHPTYIPVQPSDPAFTSMAASTRKFSNSLIDTINRIIEGVDTANLTQAGEYMFVTFTVDNVTYYVMDKRSYPNSVK